MTSRPSFTSSSDVTCYLRTLAVTLGVLIVSLVGITAAGYHLGLVDASNHAIYSYQRAKIDRLPSIDIVFVGDSSLGNAINADLFGQLSGAPTANLALTGSFGSGGAYNMIRAVMADHRPRLFVVLQTIDVMHRKEAFPGFYFSAAPGELLTTSPIQILELYFSQKTAKKVLAQVADTGFADTAERIENDYITQRGHPIGRPPREEVAIHPLLPDMVADTQLGYIRRIADLCRSADVACVYAHGPVFDGYCHQAAAYIAELNVRVRAAGLDVVPGTPLCMEEAEVGNSIDHVRSDLKDAYTRRYYDLLRPYVDKSAARH
jgi:hypothetical protein